MILAAEAGGGNAARSLARMTDGLLRRAVVDKGRMRPLLERTPVRGITNDKTALLGAVRVAAERGGLLRPG
jgi:glucokinase